MIEFILFVLVGLCLFLPMSERAKMVAMVVYVVLMVVMLVGVGGYNFGNHFGFK